MAAEVNFFITLTPTAEVMTARLREMASYKIPLAMKRGIDVAMPHVIEDIKTNRLSGKGPFPPSEHRLGEVTGLLKSSVSPLESTMDVSEDSCTVTGGLQVLGVPYANIHEFGFSGNENVPEHARNFVRMKSVVKPNVKFGAATGGLPARTRQLLRRPVRERVQSTVRAHTRQMNMPARAPFRTGMQENLIRIRDSIAAELGHAMENV